MKIKVLLTLAVCAMQSAQAVIIREDVDDREYLQLANNEGAYTPGSMYPNLSGVVAIEKHNGGTGSGALIGTKWILTAAHVIVEEGEPLPDASDFTVYFGPSVEEATRTLSIKAYYLQPDYQRAILENISEEILVPLGLDIALIELNEPVTDVPRMEFSFGAVESTGTRIIACGYGDYGTGSAGVLLTNSEKRAYENTLDRVLTNRGVDPTLQNAIGGQFATDFDNPEGTTNTLNGEPSTVPGAEPIPYLGNGASDFFPLTLEGTAAGGDSGGPTLMNDNGVWRIIGLSAFGNMEDEMYGDISVTTRVGNFSGWILTTVNQQVWGQTFYGANGWLWKQNVGGFYAGGFPFYYHPTVGWFFMSDNITNGGWFYSGTYGWCYTSESVLPWVAVGSEGGQWRPFFDFTE